MFKIKDLYSMLNDHLVKYNITRHNNKLTRFTPHQQPSSLDHIYSNCINKIINVVTHSNATSDHSIVTAQYLS